MDVFLQAVVVIGAVVIGVRFGSIGLGICGGGGLMILNQVFGLRPTGAPVDSYYFGGCDCCIYDAGRRRHRLHGQNRRTNHSRESQTHCFHCTARHMVFLFLSRYG